MMRQLPIILLPLEIAAGLVAPAARAYDPAYDELFPYYIEYSTGTQVRQFNEEEGGIGGHAVVFVKGLCKDFSVAYPRVKVCDPLEKLPVPHDGVGITVDSQFENTNWVAVPGYDFFIYGELPPGGKLTQSEVDRTVEKAYEMRIFEGVKMKPATVSRDLAGEAYTKAMLERSVSTDFAVTYGRTMQSHRVPIQQGSLQEIADMLNAVNEPYLKGLKSYVWDRDKNNCAHLSAHIFATAGIREPIPQDLPKYRQIFHLAIPGNGIMTLQDRTNFRNIDPMHIWTADSALRDSILRRGELPVGAGSLSELKSIVMNNQIFDVFDLKRLVFPPRPLLRSYCVYGNSLKSYREAQYSELGRNLEFWREKYQSALKSARPGKCLGGRKCIEFMEKYSEVLRREIGATGQKIEKLSALTQKAKEKPRD